MIAAALGLLAQAPPLEAGALDFDTPTVDWVALAPLLVLSVGALLLLTVDSLWRGTKPAGVYTLWTVVTASAAGLATLPLWGRLDDLADGTPPVDGLSTVGGAFGVDGFSLFLTAVLCASVVLAALLAHDYLPREGMDGPAMYVLLMVSAAGGIVMASANDLLVLFLGLETLSIAVYVMAAMHLRRIQSQEAGMKYFVLGAFASAFFLYGMAMIYGATGTTSFIEIKAFLAENLLLSNGLLLLGLMFLLVGLAFKVGAVPFHTWTPDVYDGSPSPAVAWMAAGVKVAGFAALLRVFVVTFDTYQSDWAPVVAALAVLTLLVGAVLAVMQSNVKRMMAYSSIVHAGFLLVGVQVSDAIGTSAVLFYLGIYAFLAAGTFGVIGLVDRAGDRHHQIEDYRGLARSSPMLAVVFTLLLLGQAGVPFTSGFLAKFGIIAAAADAGDYWMAIVAMLAAVIAAFVYLRLVVTMWVEGAPVDEPMGGPAVEKVPVPFATRLALAICAIVTLGVGVLPGPAFDLADESTPALVRDEVPAADAVPFDVGF